MCNIKKKGNLFRTIIAVVMVIVMLTVMLPTSSIAAGAAGTRYDIDGGVGYLAWITDGEGYTYPEFFGDIFLGDEGNRFPVFCLDQGEILEDDGYYSATKDIERELFLTAELKNRIAYIIKNAESIGQSIGAISSASYGDLYSADHRVYLTALQAAIWNLVSGVELIDADTILSGGDGMEVINPISGDTIDATDFDAEVAMLRRIDTLYNALIDPNLQITTPVADVSTKIDTNSAYATTYSGEYFFGPITVNSTVSEAAELAGAQLAVSGDVVDTGIYTKAADGSFSEIALSGKYGTLPVAGDANTAANVENGEGVYVKVTGEEFTIELYAQAMAIAPASDYTEPVVFSAMNSEGVQDRYAGQLVMGIVDGASLYAEDSASVTRTKPIVVPEKPVTVTITKTDAKDGKPLGGAAISVQNTETGETVYSGVTNASGEITFTVMPGSYSFAETSAPEGYILNNTSYSFSVSKTGEVTGTLSLTNEPEPVEPFEVVITKTDAATGTAIAGATITVWNSETDEEVYSGKTDENGKLIFEVSEAGTYSFKETEAPAGYELNRETYEFTIDSEGEITGTTTLTNKRIMPTIPPENVIRPSENDEDEFIEFDEDGTPLGTWTQDPDSGEWVFTPWTTPQTGDNSSVSNYLFLLIFASAMLFVIFFPRKKRASN